MEWRGNINNNDCKPNEHMKKNLMQGWFAKFTLYLQVKNTYRRCFLGRQVPGKSRMFLYSLNVAGVVFKKTD